MKTDIKTEEREYPADISYKQFYFPKKAPGVVQILMVPSRQYKYCVNDISFSFKVKTDRQKKVKNKTVNTLAYKTSQSPSWIFPRGSLFIFQSSRVVRLVFVERESTEKPVN